MKFPYFIFLLWPFLTSAQERKDEELPHVKQLAMISTMTGWTKNDLGKWSSTANSLPRYSHNYFFPICEEILKISLGEITYKKKQFYCVAKFTKHKYVHLNAIRIEYPVDYWLFDPSAIDTLIGQVGSVQALSYSTTQTGSFSGTSLASWKDVSNDIFMHFEDGLPITGNFCIQSRADVKNGKYQFLIGSYTGENRFDFNYCTVPGDNNELKNGYYEVPATIFLGFMAKMK